MEIYLDKRAVKQIRLSTAEAIEEGDTEALKDDIVDAFPEEQVETVEQMIGGGDFMDLVAETLDEWSGDDVDELFDLLETQLRDLGVDLKCHTSADEGDDDDDAQLVDDDELGDDDQPGFDDDDL